MFFDYGQTHLKEILSARKICKDANVKLHECKLPSVFIDSALVGSKPIPSGDSDSNIVPNRNMIMISTAASFAIQQGSGFDAVAIGCNEDDAQHGFPDCSRHFLRSMRDAMRFCHTRPIALLAPFVHKRMSKVEIVKLARKLNVPIDDTWSCYKGEKEPCGTCAACELRDNAMKAHDPHQADKKLDDETPGRGMR
jgi:7-cyano-7-deazaguanine synthase